MSVTLNDNISTHAPKPIEARSMDFSGGISIPYASLAAAKTAIPSAYRHQYLTIWVLATNGDPLEYWWRADTTDASLEPKNKESFTLNTDGSIVLNPPYRYGDIIVIVTNNIATLKIGTTVGGGELEPGAAVTTTTPYTFSSVGYVGSARTIYFTGVTTGTKILVYKNF